MEARRALSVIRVLTVLALFSLLTACPCVEVTTEGRIQAMDSVRTALEELPDNATSAEILTVAAEAMDGRQEFEASGTAPEYGMAWGRFPGGATYVVDANGRPGYSSFPVDADLQDAFTAPFPLPAALSDPMLEDIGLPADSSTLTGIPAGPAVLFQVLGPEYANVTEVLSPWLLEAGYSTTVNPQVGGTVEDLQKIDGPAFFYMGTHGIIATLFPSPAGEIS